MFLGFSSLLGKFMTSLLDTLSSQLTGGAVKQIAQNLGTNDAATSAAISAALPVLLGALARNAATPDGAASLSNALTRDHDGSILNDIGGAVSNFQGGPGAGILKHVLGGKQDVVAQGLGQAAGIDAGKAGALLTMLAPMVMGALGKAQRSGGLDAGGLAAMLGQERQRMAPAGGIGGLLSFLDADKDGSVVDDVLGMAAKFLRK